MAAHEQEVEGVVPLGRVFIVRGEGDLLLRGHQADHYRLPVAARGLGADMIGDASRRDLDQPAAWVIRQTIARPLRRRRDQGFLNLVLRGGEVVEPPDHGAQHLRREVAQEVLGRGVQRRGHQVRSLGGPLITCRTSIARLSGVPPGPGAAEASAAIA